MRFKRVAAVAAAATLALGMAACGGDDSDEGTGAGSKSFAAGSTMERLNKAQKIKVGTKFDQPGFGQKGLSGKPEGFDVEIAKIIVKELGIPEDKIEYVETPSKVREDVIVNGTVDLVAATYTINDKRKERIAFAGPYYEAGQNIMVRKDDTSITGPDSFKDGTKKVCSVTGSTPIEEIKKYVKDVATQVVPFDTYDKCRDALKSGQVDAVTTDNVILLGYIAKDEASFKMAGDNFTKEPYGIGVKKEDTDFRNFINDVLEKAMQDGRWKKAWDDTAGKFGATLGDAPTINRY
ncbi:MULTISPECIES: glutamate ABC transporter substrate-binding protein [Micromonospora]|uniref:Glutamate ABC transporter substrate-binding protein n=1 Tax=Micromonospora solifontis TaxID=2487138 RepID=A0ABX9WQ36_9ACTN|nr:MULTISPECIES: glutamate ABC transporter substrate-binding protein [Micromonospora]NES12841.1 glutamate ABC transporter substrate-binding protein [Micromonospora sp. PPF5-17B]NES34841.1 glutamate ABC transporter substrate-binding protein [Micromonospora solifontis]NES54766.1 glutamate ABC transporter substrate-binding protein [Micromonospora sp. PPF5-6]RNM01733.1 glutamate ABC transporter substrate-binding protein [Micromonospora solifontis]